MKNQIHVSLLTVCESYKSPCEQNICTCMAEFSCLGRIYLWDVAVAPRRDGVIVKNL